MTPSYKSQLAVAFALLLGSCSRLADSQYVMREYDLAPCPPSNYELPEMVYDPNFTIEANGWGQYCHGFTRYELQGLNLRKGAKPYISRDFVYARLKPGQSCRLQVVSELHCGKSLEACDQMLLKVYGAGLTDLSKRVTDAFAEDVLHALKYKAKLESSQSSYLGSVDQIAARCAAMAGA